MASQRGDLGGMAENQVTFPYGWRWEHRWWEPYVSFGVVLLIIGILVGVWALAQPPETYCWQHLDHQSCAWVE